MKPIHLSIEPIPPGDHRRALELDSKREPATGETAIEEEVQRMVRARMDAEEDVSS
jgi:hypothetical protein